MTLFAALGLWATGDYSIGAAGGLLPARTGRWSRSTSRTRSCSATRSPRPRSPRCATWTTRRWSTPGTSPRTHPSSGMLEPQDQITRDRRHQGHRPCQPAGRAEWYHARARWSRSPSSRRQDDGRQGHPRRATRQARPRLSGHRPRRPADGAVHPAPSRWPNIGGPSAGLMFTLGLIDKLTPGELTGGRFIARHRRDRACRRTRTSSPRSARSAAS